jgi:lipopolysaccharide export system protein LptA
VSGTISEPKLNWLLNLLKNILDEQHISKFVPYKSIMFNKGLHLLLFFFLISCFSFGQTKALPKSKEVKQINLLHADIGKFSSISGKSAQRLIGNVKAEHEGSMLYCDSAYLYNNNSIDAFGNVHINVNDTLDMYGDQVFYDGNTKIAEFHDHVRLVDKQATLYTDILIYDRKIGIGQYFIWGRIEDSVNVLTSKKGYYYNQIETVFFKDSVVVVNPDYIMKSDTLKYETKFERIHFMGPTTITGDSSYLYSERGYHDSKTKESKLTQNAYVQNKTNILHGDSIYYNKELGLAKAYYDVLLIDTAQDVTVTGEYAIYNKRDLYAYVVDSAQAIFAQNQDSLFLHADTLILRFDSLEKAKHLLAYNHMKFFKSDVQGMADSMAYDIQDSIMRLFQNPVIWLEGNQISCNRIDLISKNEKLDSAAFLKDVFLVSQDTVDPQFYNQLSGNNMYAWFVDGDLRKLFMDGNSETIYFLWEEDGTPIGMNKIQSKNMLIYIRNQELETITYIEKPTATLTPTPLVNPLDTKLRGFQWREDIRPKKKADIFKKESVGEK